MASKVRRVSRSEFAVFRRCKRKWWLQFVRKLELRGERSPGALEEGSLSHRGIEVFVETGSVQRGKEAIMDLAFELVGADVPEGEWSETVARAQNYLEGYVEWLVQTGKDQRYEHVSSEEELEMPLVEIDGVQWVLTGKLDRRVRDRVTGLQAFIDYKTCTRFEDLIEDAVRNEQFPTYSALLEHHTGEQVMGGVWRMLRKVQRARDGEGKYFEDHGPVYFNEEYRSSVLDRFCAMAFEMQELTEQLEGEHADRPFHRRIAYPNPTHTCKWDCREFKLVCDMLDDGSRAEAAINDLYVRYDPYARYTQLGREEEA